MTFAEVAVDAPSVRRTTGFHYRVPPGLEVKVGHMVTVPFGARQAQGIVIELCDTSPVDEVKEIARIVDLHPILSPVQIALARWISAYYCCSPSDAIGLMVPPGIMGKASAAYKLADYPSIEGLPPRQAMVVGWLKGRGVVAVGRMRKTLGVKGLERVLAQLARNGIVEKIWDLQGPRVKPKMEKYLRLNIGAEDFERVSEGLQKTPRQLAAFQYLVGVGAIQDGSIRTVFPLQEVIERAGADRQVITALVKKGLVQVEEREAWRDPLAGQVFAPSESSTLTPTQEAAWQPIERNILDGGFSVFLLHGVTGSGKTEIYLKAIERNLLIGKQAMVLVPEIALTPQTVHRFAGHFPGQVGLLHSRLTPGEHYDEWRRIRSGQVDIVIGARSAVFAPMPRLGVIIVDEEHEASYKQDQPPPYHTRDVAIKLGELTPATVILGSATPDVVSYRRAELGRYKLLTLPERYGGPGKALGGRIMPHVEVVDMRRELREGHRGIFSRPLMQAMEDTLAEGAQVILFLNRRGSSTLVVCRDCGYVMKCSRCDVAMVYHTEAQELFCHQCSAKVPVPQMCPNCWGPRIRYFGLGTERVEEEVKHLFPLIKVVRWDRDTTGGRLAHEAILRRFSRGEAQVLVGTQMIAKGLDFPEVSLVGVILADTSLHLPDLKAVERTFQLLTQVAGRAGRGEAAGRVIIQTYTPYHYCIQAASRHDYDSFYRQEMRFRAEHGYPPFAQLAKLVYTHSREGRCEEEARRIAGLLRLRVDQMGLPDVAVLGPAPAYRRRIRGRYRWQIILKGSDVHPLISDFPLPRGWAVDVDPVTFL